MPILLKIEEDPSIEIAIWSIAEDKSYFEKKLLIHSTEYDIISNLSPRKYLEWVCSRYLLHVMSGRKSRGVFTKDIHGKPHLEQSDYHISISHSNNLIAVIASKFVVGVDIQYYVQKITRIQSKFVGEDELEMIKGIDTIQSLHIIWGAKESLYKAYGKRGLDFKKHINITELKLNGSKGSCLGQIKKDDHISHFSISIHLYSKYLLVYAKKSI